MRKLTLPWLQSPRVRTWGLLSLAVFTGFSVLIGIAYYSVARQHGLLGRYYANPQWSGTPVKTVRDTEIALHRARTLLSNNYSIAWTGLIFIPIKGTYEFTIVADDGAALSIEQRLLVDGLRVPKMQKYTGSVELEPGFFPITIKYFQREDASALHVYWVKPGNAKKEELPPTALFVKQPGPVALSIERGLALTWEVVWLIWLLGVVIGVGIGCFYYQPLKILAQQLVLLVCSLLFCLLILEALLRTGWFDNKGTVWIPRKYRILDKEIERKNYFQFASNPYHFNDNVREPQKPAGQYRIAVLGDSFVWGDGLAQPAEQAWGRKLAQKVAQPYPQVEIMNWGLPGWSTDNEFRFLKKDGIQYQPDFLIVGFVVNDPDMYFYTKKELEWQNPSAWYSRFVLNPLDKLFPDAFDFVMTYLNTFLTDVVLKGYGYKYWHEQLYSPENLQRYGALLKEFSDYCKARNLPLLFVMTPHSYEKFNEDRIATIIPLLRQANIEYLDLYPAVVNAFAGKYARRELWANPANAHPGPLVTELFAAETFKYLQQKGIFPKN